MDGDGSFIPGSMPAFDRASRRGRFDEEEGEGGSGQEEEDDDVGAAYFSKKVGEEVELCAGRGMGVLSALYVLPLACPSTHIRPPLAAWPTTTTIVRPPSTIPYTR